MNKNLEIEIMDYRHMPVSAQHGLLDHCVITVNTPEMKAAIPILVPVVTKLAIINSKMRLVDTNIRAFVGSAKISDLNKITHQETVGLNASFNFFATNPSASDEEKAAARVPQLEFRPFYKQRRRAVSISSEQLKDVLSRMLESPLLEKVTAIHQLEAVQNLKAHNDQRIALRNARAQEKRVRVDNDALYELCVEARPYRNQLFLILNYHAQFGSDEQKALTQHAIQLINAEQDAVRREMRRHATLNAKKKGEATADQPDKEHPEHDGAPSGGENSSSESDQTEDRGKESSSKDAKAADQDAKTSSEGAQ